MILGQVVAGLFALWCVYHLYFSAFAALCFALDTEEAEDIVITNNISIVAPAEAMNSTALPPPPPASTINTAHHSYMGQGANMDGPASFVDLEANLPASSSISDTNSSTSRRRRRKNKNKDRIRPNVTAAHGKTQVEDNTQQGEVSDLSESSSAGDESADTSSHHSDTINKNNSEKSLYSSSSNHSYATAGWYDLEPSDDSDVVYSLTGSSGEENNDHNSDIDENGTLVSRTS